MFKNKKIYERYDNGKQELLFDADSSPAAWAHYKEFYCYNDYLTKNYDFSQQFFYVSVGLNNGFCAGGEWLNYVSKPSALHNRLYVLKKGTTTREHNGYVYIAAAKRLGGECDFNFKEKKAKLFLQIIESDLKASQQEKSNTKIQLSRCSEMHHTLLNFSLMQAMGDMQSFKGSNRYDRFDTFVYELDNYYRGISNAILQSSSPNNEQALISFLNDFADVYEYCATFNFIKDKSFVDKIIRQGSMPITNVSELVRYMNLAEEYWNKKESEFLKLGGKNEKL